MCTAEQTLVLVDPAERRAVAIPDGYREAIEELRRRRPRAGGGADERGRVPRRARGDRAGPRTARARPTRSSGRRSRSSHDRFDHYSWVGIYLVEGDDLVLGPWKGPQATEHVRIPIGQGICGAAAASGETEIVDDVNTDERYLACFVSTRSEIVVPIAYEGRVVGEIDIDSDVPGAFGEVGPRSSSSASRRLVSQQALVAWDTGGVAWTDVS